MPGRFSDRELLFGGAIAQLCMRSWPVMIAGNGRTPKIRSFRSHPAAAKLWFSSSIRQLVRVRGIHCHFAASLHLLSTQPSNVQWTVASWHSSAILRVYAFSHWLSFNRFPQLKRTLESPLVSQLADNFASVDLEERNSAERFLDRDGPKKY